MSHSSSYWTSESTHSRSSDTFYPARSDLTPSSSSSISDSGSECTSIPRHCFCGVKLPDVEFCFEEDQDGIYCSSSCARADAMAALEGDEVPEALILADAQPDLPLTLPETPLAQSAPIVRSLTASSLAASLALQRNTMGLTHYRRMGAMDLYHEQYPAEIIEAALRPSPELIATQRSSTLPEDEVSLTDPTHPSFALQRWMEENELQDAPHLGAPCQSARQSSHLEGIPEEIHLDAVLDELDHISAASDDSSLFERDSTTETARRNTIEHSLCMLDNELRQRLADFDRKRGTVDLFAIPSGPIEHNGQLNTAQIEEEEEDILMEFNSPNLAYEAPLGWRRGSRVYSQNFLGLQLDPKTPILSPASSHRATFDHTTTCDPLDSPSSVHSMDKKTSAILTHAVPDALNMAQDLALLQAAWSGRKHIQALQSTSPSPAAEPLSPLSPMAAPSLHTTAMAPSFSEPGSHNGKLSLATFFQRRPSAPTLSASTQASSTFPSAQPKSPLLRKSLSFRLPRLDLPSLRRFS